MVGKLGKMLILFLVVILFAGTITNGLYIATITTNEESFVVDENEHERLDISSQTSVLDTTRGSVGQPRARPSTGIVGPLELLKNNTFDTISGWTQINAYNSTYDANHTLTIYNSGTNYVQFISDVPIEPDETPFDIHPIKAKIQQNFYKPCWTTTTPNEDIVIFSFDYAIDEFVGTIDTSNVIFGEFFLEVESVSTGITAEWPLEATRGAFDYGDYGHITENDQRLQSGWYTRVEDISEPPLGSSFSIHPPGWYRLALVFQLWTDQGTNEPNIFTQFNVTVDNISLIVNDNEIPQMSNPDEIYSFGPYNDQTYDNDTFGKIDVDFEALFINNTPLKLGKYRLNNSGTPGSWYQIFEVNQSHNYTQNWSISYIWPTMVQGENTVDVYCKDQVGNYNGSLRITVFKDTVKPESNTSLLKQYYTTKNVNISYSATDPGLASGTSGGFNNTVVLMFKNATETSYMNYTPPWNPSGLFNHTPIRFNLDDAGGYGEGDYSFYTVAIDNTTNHEDAPTGPDTTTIIDYIKPTSNAEDLDDLISVRTFDVSYTAADSTSGIDYVELWYEINNVWFQWNNSNGETNFTSSPIEFTAGSDGIYGFYTVAYDKAGNIELGRLPTANTQPDTTTTVDSQAPTPIFLLPINGSKIRGKETLIVKSDFDTEYMEFYYWVDVDKDGFADDINDINSTWKFIDNVSFASGLNWSTDWNTRLNLKNMEEQVVLKAVGADRTDKKGAGTVIIEVDNKDPVVEITNPKAASPENRKTIFINYTTDTDVDKVNIFYKIKDKEITWNTIIEDFAHNYGTPTGSYKWNIPDSLFGSQPDVIVMVEAVDDVKNSGNDTVTFGINKAYPIIKPGFPIEITMDEDFGKYSLKVTEYEDHSNDEFSEDNLKWYVTGNSGTIFYIAGDNSTGIAADTFVFTSILDKSGDETLTYHLYDPDGWEARITQKFIVNPKNDPPVFLPPAESIYVTVGEADTLDLSPYVDDVDNELSELTVSTDDSEHISTDGLKLIFNYGTDWKGKTKTIRVTVSDVEDSTTGNLKLILTDNHRPQLIKPFPSDEDIRGGTKEEKVLNLNDHFSDPDGDTLTYTVESTNIIVTINSDGTVDMEAPEDISIIEKISFRATDPSGAFADGFMFVQIIDINNPPRIKPIPDIFIHYYTPAQADKYPGYSYDFSYFISDPDDKRSELKIKGIPVEENLFDYVEPHPDFNLKLVFKFPFEVADLKKHPIWLYVEDPQKAETRILFNVTVIIDNWPVELIGQIDDQSFEEDGSKEDAFNIDHFFEDKDTGTSYEVITIENSKLNVEIDQDNNVDLSTNKKDWFGEEEVVILAHDQNPEQYVYAVFTVIVRAVNDPPTIESIEPIIVTVDEEKIINLDEYINDVDTPISSLALESADPDHVSVSAHLLYIKYDKVGKYTVQIRVVDVDKTSALTELQIEVQEKKETEEVIPQWLILTIIIVIIVVVLILVMFMLMMSKYKVHEVFLIHKSGILLHHLSREHIPGRDEEILSGMFTAVQEFIKDSFSTSGRHGAVTVADDYVLREMKIGDNNNILIERGKYIYLAVIFSGKGANKLRTKVRNLLEDIESRYEAPFKTWVGDMDKLAGIDKLLDDLIPEGGQAVMAPDRQLGRVPTPRPGSTAPTPERPSAVTPVAPAPSMRPKPTQPAVTPVRPKPQAQLPPKTAAVTPKPATAVKPVKPKPATAPVTPATAKPAAVQPKPTATATKPAVSPTPAPAKVQAQKPTAAAAVAAKPAQAQTKPAGGPICPKCGAAANKFPDGSMLCPKCGYTGK